MTRLFHPEISPRPSGSPGTHRHRPALCGAYEGSVSWESRLAGASSPPAPAVCVVSSLAASQSLLSASLIPRGTDGRDPGVPSSNTSLRRVQHFVTPHCLLLLHSGPSEQPSWGAEQGTHLTLKDVKRAPGGPVAPGWASLWLEMQSLRPHVDLQV